MINVLTLRYVVHM